LAEVRALGKRLPRLKNGKPDAAGYPSAWCGAIRSDLISLRDVYDLDIRAAGAGHLKRQVNLALTRPDNSAKTG
jgi:hypothetical protein